MILNAVIFPEQAEIYRTYCSCTFPPQILQKQLSRTILKPEYVNYKYRSNLYDTIVCDLSYGALQKRSETKPCKFSFSSSNSFTSKHSTNLLNKFNAK